MSKKGGIITFYFADAKHFEELKGEPVNWHKVDLSPSKEKLKGVKNKDGSTSFEHTFNCVLQEGTPYWEKFGFKTLEEMQMGCRFFIPTKDGYMMSPKLKDIVKGDTTLTPITPIKLD